VIGGTGFDDRRASDDLRAVGRAVLEVAPEAVAAALVRAEGAIRSAPVPAASVKVWPRLLNGLKVSKPRKVTAKGKASGTVRVGGTAPTFSGGGSVRQLVMGHEFGAVGGDNVVRVRTSGGRSQTVDASRFSSYATSASRQFVGTYTRADGKVVRRSAKAGAAGAERITVTGVRRGGLAQFPAVNSTGYVLTRALDDDEVENLDSIADVIDETLERVWLSGRS